MNVSRRGVYYNIKESPYHKEIQGTTYYFSSPKRQELFHKKFAAAWVKVKVKFSIISKEQQEAMIAWECYKQTEPRGGLIINEDGEELTCQQTVQLDGRKIKLKNSTEM